MTVVNVTPGVVRNLLKTPYFLRIPRQEVNKLLKHDRQSSTIELQPNIDVIIFWKDFDAIEDQLNKLDRDNIVRIIRRPHHAESGIVAVEKDGATVITHADFLNFHGPITIVNEGANRAGVTVLSNAQGIEIPFLTTDWVNNQMIVIPFGVLAAGQIGPHLLPVNSRQYVVNAFHNINANVRQPVGLDIYINRTTGFITIHKAPRQDPFNGLVVVTANLI